mgnify:CR=1 FL=1
MSNMLMMKKREVLKFVTEQANDCSVEIGFDRDRLEREWYSSGCSDYSIYDSQDYISELIYCWSEYSKGYLKNLLKLNLLPTDPKRIIDLGCGLGLSTLALKQIFPQAEVIGTNLKGSNQFKLCNHLASKNGFHIEENFNDAGHCDFVFASEYFEHIRNPIDHLFDLIERTKPKSLYVANSFAARSSGHFDSYIVDSQQVDNKKMGKIFNSEMRLHGYEKISTTLWNDRPTYWKLSDLDGL